MFCLKIIIKTEQYSTPSQNDKMKIIIQSKLNTLPQLLIFPIVKKDDLTADFEHIEAQIGKMSHLLKSDFKGERGETHILYSDTSKITLLGLGKKPDFASVLKTFRSFAHQNKKILGSKIGVNFLHFTATDSLPSYIDAATNGLQLATYNIHLFKSSTSDVHPFDKDGATLTFYVDENIKDDAQAQAEKGAEMAGTQKSIFNLVNAPSNKKLPTHLSNWAKASGEKHAYQVNVLEKEAIEELGLYGLLAVNRGSEFPPTFTIMEYRPADSKGKELPKVGLVGKGVTFDTGGLSLKPSNNMHYMKSDMGGAAAVLGTMEMVAKLQLPVHLIGIVPATDNSIGEKAIKPSDVIDSYSGKTIEIIDTDAEGRLILADGLAYMVKHFKPDTLIDLATLTGSTVRTFGYHAAALMSNSDDLAQALSVSGDATGERVWRLPIWKVYESDIKSDVADVRNYSGRPLAGAIGAAKFLEVFTDEHPNWAHLDIAGTAFGDSEFSSQKSASGFGVRLLIDYLSRL